MRTVSLRMTDFEVKVLEEITRKGRFKSLSAALRVAIQHFAQSKGIKREAWEELRGEGMRRRPRRSIYSGR